jgi:hypothetical protein
VSTPTLKPMPLGEGLNEYQISGIIRCLHCGDPTPLQVRSDFALWHPVLGVWISKQDTTALHEGSNVQGLP